MKTDGTGNDGVQATRLSQINFCELFLGHPVLGDRLSDAQTSQIRPLPQNRELLQDVEQLKSVCREAGRMAPSASELRVIHDDVSYRVFSISTLRGLVTVLRRVASAIGLLADLGVPAACTGPMLAKELSGLFLISGPMKSGKTTTACTMVKERLGLHGGIAVTAEDPTELPLEGKHGDGICYQTMVPSDGGGFPEAFARITRWGPSIIFIGEIRDRDTAVEALQASIAGRLVISTIRSESLVKAVMKLHALANEKMVSGGAQLLSDGLIGVLHQRLVGAVKPRLEAEFLYLKDAQSARRHILEGKYDMLANDIEGQTSTLFAAVPQRRKS
jgi:type II secretory ATPase GspE/PulE/Tfp pilus assembly ATPase PilB-like protein